MLESIVRCNGRSAVNTRCKAVVADAERQLLCIRTMVTGEEVAVKGCVQHWDCNLRLTWRA
jgi:hypothetical protein